MLSCASAQLFVPLVPCTWAVVQVHHDRPYHEDEVPVDVLHCVASWTSFQIRWHQLTKSKLEFSSNNQRALDHPSPPWLTTRFAQRQCSGGSRWLGTADCWNCFQDGPTTRTPWCGATYGWKLSPHILFRAVRCGALPRLLAWRPSAHSSSRAA